MQLAEDIFMWAFTYMTTLNYWNEIYCNLFLRPRSVVFSVDALKLSLTFETRRSISSWYFLFHYNRNSLIWRYRSSTLVCFINKYFRTNGSENNDFLLGYSFMYSCVPWRDTELFSSWIVAENRFKLQFRKPCPTQQRELQTILNKMLNK